MTTLQRHRFYYGWVIVAVSYLSVFWALGTRFSFGVFYVAILNEYGWSRAETAGAFSLAMIVHGIFAPVSGHLVDRFGPRLLFPFGAAFLALGLFAASRVESLAGLYFCYGILIAIGVNTLSYAPHMAIISKWFKKKRGLASGLVLAGIGTGMMALAPSIQLVIDSFGWRRAFLILSGVVALLLIPLTAIFQRRSPEEMGQRLDGIQPEAGSAVKNQTPGVTTKAPANEPGRAWSLGQLLRTRDFWCLLLSPFSGGLVMNMVVVHLAAYVIEAGYPPVLAATLVGAVGLLGAVGGILGGGISDRLTREGAFALSGLTAAIGVCLLLMAGGGSSSPFLYAFVLLYGLGHGSMAPINAAKTGDLFGGQSIGLAMGLLSMGFGLGGAVGAFIGGAFYDMTGSYTVPFLVLIGTLGIGTFGMWAAGNRERRQTM